MGSCPGVAFGDFVLVCVRGIFDFEAVPPPPVAFGVDLDFDGVFLRAETVGIFAMFDGCGCLGSAGARWPC